MQEVPGSVPPSKPADCSLQFGEVSVVSSQSKIEKNSPIDALNTYIGPLDRRTTYKIKLMRPKVACFTKIRHVIDSNVVGNAC